MNTLPALTTLANAAVRRQFLPTPPTSLPVRSTGPSRTRLALAAALERAAHAVAPAGYRPAH